MNILIVNMHSALNLGDEGIFRATLKGVREKYPGSKITIAANDPESWRRHTEIEILPSLCTWVADCRLGEWRRKAYRMPLVLGYLILTALLYRYLRLKLRLGSSLQKKLQIAYYEADLILSCGGGYLYAHRRLSPGFIWNLLILSYGTWLGKRVVMLPQSIGPVLGGLQRTLARLALRRVPTVLAREAEAVQFWREKLLLPAEPVLLADLAFALPTGAPAPALPAPEGAVPLRVGVTVMDRAAQDPTFHRQQEYEAALAWLLIELNRIYHAHISIFIQCYGPSPDQNDVPAARRLYQAVSQATGQVALLDGFKDSLEIKAAYAQMDIVLGTRMHSCIYALSSGVPVLLIGYQPKAAGMMQSLGLQKYCCPIDQVDRHRLLELAGEIVDQRQSLVVYIRSQVARLEDILRDWTRYLEP